MKTKLLSLLLCMAMCLSLLTACGSGSSAPAQEAASSSAAVSSAAQSAEESASAPAEESASAEAQAPEEEETAVAPEINPNAPEIRVGMLTILNMSEEDAAEMMRGRMLASVQLAKEGCLSGTENMPDSNGKVTVTFYDDLGSMLMALNAGQIDSISITESVAEYLAHTNEGIVMPATHDDVAPHSAFANQMENGLMGEGYSFMLMADHEQLRDELDRALDSMKDDGTLDRLIKEQIDDVLAGKEPVEIELPPIADAETIEVAVTGALPPMDYVSSIGMPVGFSTAVLAEISTRIHKNISVSVIDSGARASALSSGRADVVFWTRTSTAATAVKEMSEQERYALGEELKPEELTVIQQINSIYDFTKYADMDMPEGTIVTQAYYSGFNLPVLSKG